MFGMSSCRYNHLGMDSAILVRQVWNTIYNFQVHYFWVGTIRITHRIDVLRHMQRPLADNSLSEMLLPVVVAVDPSLRSSNNTVP
jgi:hypothetical protein